MQTFVDVVVILLFDYFLCCRIKKMFNIFQLERTSNNYKIITDKKLIIYIIFLPHRRVINKKQGKE